MLSPIRELSVKEVDSLSIPLRQKVLQGELHWTNQTGSQSCLRDRFDAHSIHFGFFVEGVLAGALRLTIAENTAGLPSSRHIPQKYFSEIRVAELSRAVVEKIFRGRYIFPRLLRAGLDRAASERVDSVFGSVLEKESHIYVRYGFVSIVKPFVFNDGVIAPPYPALVMRKSMSGV
jgi:hypothetical protein